MVHVLSHASNWRQACAACAYEGTILHELDQLELLFEQIKAIEAERDFLIAAKRAGYAHTA